MGLLGKIGHVVGKVAKIAAPVLAVTGVGAPLAAGIEAAGTLMDHGNLKDALINGGMTFAGGKLAGTAAKVAGGAAKLGKIGAAGKAALSAAGGPGAAPAAAGAGGGGGLLGTLGKIGGGLLHTAEAHPELAASALGGITAAYQGHKADQTLNRAMGTAQQQYDDRAPLRAIAMAGMKAPIPQRPNLGSMFADPGNPYARSVAP